MTPYEQLPPSQTTELSRCVFFPRQCNVKERPIGVSHPSRPAPPTPHILSLKARRCAATGFLLPNVIQMLSGVHFTGGTTEPEHRCHTCMTVPVWAKYHFQPSCENSTADHELLIVYYISGATLIIKSRKTLQKRTASPLCAAFC